MVGYGRYKSGVVKWRNPRGAKCWLREVSRNITEIAIGTEGVGRWEVGFGRWELGGGRWELVGGSWEV